jgi:hypothetical protein
MKKFFEKAGRAITGNEASCLALARGRESG